MVRTLRTAALASAGLIVTQSAARPVAPAPSLCAAAERSVFSCPVGGRIVSVCGPRGGGSGDLTYRYGRPGRVELAQRGGLAYASRGYSGGGEAQISFARGGYRYVVYDRTVRTGFEDGRNDPAFTQGLLVLRGGRVALNRRCSADSGGMDGRATARLPRGAFVEH